MPESLLEFEYAVGGEKEELDEETGAAADDEEHGVELGVGVDEIEGGRDGEEEEEVGDEHEYYNIDTIHEIT